MFSSTLRTCGIFCFVYMPGPHTVRRSQPHKLVLYETAQNDVWWHINVAATQIFNSFGRLCTPMTPHFSKLTAYNIHAKQTHFVLFTIGFFYQILICRYCEQHKAILAFVERFRSTNANPPNKYIRVTYGGYMGFYVVPIWVSPAGCLVRLLTRFQWDLYGLHGVVAQMTPSYLLSHMG